MRTVWLSLIFMGMALSAPPALPAAEPYLEFVSGLRDRGYYDTALQYLEQIQSKPDLPNEVRELIPFEKALTLLDSVRTIRNPAAQNEQLDQAMAFLEEFAKASPNHPKRGLADSNRAKILLGKARVEVWQSRSPANEGGKGEFQRKAREYIKQARQVFQTAHDQYKASWEVFPKFIDQQEDREQFAAREKAEGSYIQAQLDLALCTYEDAQTYDVNSVDFKRVLTQASTEFEDIHTKYRSQVGGLYARMWQGKCFEEQDDIKKALGIYNELLQHPGTSATMQRLQNQVRQFRLICLNHDQRKDYQLVNQEADEWLKQNRREARSEVGLGIRWELALAQESLAEKRDLSPVEKERYLRQSLANVREINRHPGRYKDISMFMVRRLTVKLRGDEGDPEDFDTAFGLAREMVVQGISKRDEALEAAKKSGKKKEEILELEKDRSLHLDETARMLQLAVSLADDETAAKDVNTARYFLAYVNLLLERNYESAILGEFVARHASKDESTVAQDAAYVAMAAYIKAYNASRDQADKEVDMRLIERICNLITASWPQSDRAQEARMSMGRVYNQMHDAAKAAEWYSQVPPSAAEFAEAQLAAGQAYWNAFYNATSATEEEKPTAEVITGYQNSAEKYLRSGIEKMQQQIPAEGASPADLIGGKASLVQIVLGKGDYQAGIDLLTKAPHAVMPAVAVKDEAKRPKEGITSRRFASLAAQLLLRAYVGTQQLEQARTAMQELEKIAGGDKDAGGEAVTQVYIDLGRELEKELQRLKDQNETQRLAEVRKSFETFLNDMFQRKDQTYGSLIWIAETYYGLGLGSSEDKTQADGYFDRAASTFEMILDKGTELAKPQQLAGVKLRLVNCKRRQGDFQAAIDLATSILADQPKALNAQVETAYVLQDWAGSDQGDSWKNYDIAISGAKEYGADKADVWGWGGIALQLQRLLQSRPSEAEKYDGLLYEARYNSIYCRQQYGLAQRNQTEKLENELGKAKQELLTFVAISRNIPDEWWSKYDKLYQSIQENLGESPVALVKPKEFKPITAGAPKADKKNAAKAKEVTTATVPEDDGGIGLMSIIFGVLLVAGSGAGIFFMFKNQNRRPSYSYAQAPAAAPVFSNTPSATAPATRQKVKLTPEQAAARRAKQAAAKAAGAKKSTKTPATGTPEATKPTRPKGTKSKPADPQ